MKLPTRKPRSQPQARPETDRNPVESVRTASTGAIIREKETRLETGLSRTTRWRMEKRSAFPRKVKLGPNAVGYFRAEVEQWLRERDRV
jgi:prophage regulatory protein